MGNTSPPRKTASWRPPSTVQVSATCWYGRANRRTGANQFAPLQWRVEFQCSGSNSIVAPVVHLRAKWFCFVSCLMLFNSVAVFSFLPSSYSMYWINGADWKHHEKIPEQARVCVTLKINKGWLLLPVLCNEWKASCWPKTNTSLYLSQPWMCSLSATTWKVKHRPTCYIGILENTGYADIMQFCF